jgi:hypothetical protein
MRALQIITQGGGVIYCEVRGSRFLRRVFILIGIGNDPNRGLNTLLATPKLSFLVARNLAVDWRA